MRHIKPMRLSLRPIRNYTTLKPPVDASNPGMGLRPIRNYTTLKLLSRYIVGTGCLRPIRNYTTLKHPSGCVQ